MQECQYFAIKKKGLKGESQEEKGGCWECKMWEVVGLDTPVSIPFFLYSVKPLI